MGATVVRSHTLGISVGNPLSFEPSLGIFVDAALHSADFAIATAQALGLRLQIPFTDNYHYYHGGKHTFTDWLGLSNETEFYTNPQAIAAFKQYIYRRLTHVNAYSGLTAAEDPTIMMWETGNELDAPADWTAEIAAYVKSIAPHQLVMDGNYGIDSAALSIPQVDAYSDHFYPVDAARLQADIAAVSRAGKVLVVGEFGWTSGDVAGFLQQIEAAPGCVAYDLYWSLFPHADSFGFEQHNDGFSVHWPGGTFARVRGANLQGVYGKYSPVQAISAD